VFHKAVVATKATHKLDLIAFKTNLPLDLFPQCVHQPFKTALTWNGRKYAHVIGHDCTRIEADGSLQGFFVGLLDASTVDCARDPTFAALTRGFLLSQRIFATFHMTGMSIFVGSTPDLGIL
jgi:hypothetical protein